MKGDGGLLCSVISDNIIATPRKVACKSPEALLFDLHIGRRQFALLSAYRLPTVDNTTLTTELSNMLYEASLLSDNIICMGELNCDILHPLHNNK